MSVLGEHSSQDPRKDEDHHEEPMESIKSRSNTRSFLLVATCTCAMIVNSANGTAVAIGLPTIGRALHIRENTLQWLVSSYALSSGCLMLIFGRLADLHGQKKVFVLSSIWLIAFTLGCSFANDEITLNVLRAIQGIGAAAMLPAVIGILARSFPPSRARSVAFSAFAAGAPLGAAFGMVLGGVLIEFTRQRWRSIFYLLTGLTFLTLVGGLLTFEPDKPSTELDRSVDWLGAILVTASLVLIVFVLGQGEMATQQWATPYIIALLVIGVILMFVFLWWQHFLEKYHNDDGKSRPPPSKFISYPPPLMKLSFWRRANGRFAVIMVIAFLQWSAFLSWNFWIQLYYQNFLGLQPLPTVLRLLPMFVTGGICNVLMAFIVGRIPLVIIISTGTALTSVAALLFALIKPSSPYWAFGFPAAILSVVGADFVFAGGSIFVAQTAQPHEQSVAGAIFQTVMQMGVAFGVTISTIVFDRVALRDFRSHPHPPGPLGPPGAPGSPDFNPFANGRPRPGAIGSPLAAYQAAQWTAFAFGCLATIFAIAFLRGLGVVGHPPPPRKEPEPEKGVRGQVSTDSR